MSMKGQVIGITMPHGYAGSYARQPDMIVDTHPLTGDANVTFGLGVVADSTAKGAVALPSDTSAAADFSGVAVREIKSAVNYFTQNAGQYVPNDAIPVMKRGCVNVVCQNGTPAYGGAVYLRVKLNSGTYPNAVVGGFEAAADSTNSVQLTNCQWCGPADENGVAEMRIMTIINP